MSDPVTNAEIEDVLSSIRRLVSQDGRERNEEPVQRQALVLTEAQRVEELDAKDAMDMASDRAPLDAVDAADLHPEVAARASGVVRSELEKAIEELEETMGIAGEAASDEVPELDADIDWEAPVGRAVDGPPPAAPSGGDPKPAKGRSTVDSLHLVSKAAEPTGDAYDERYEGDVLADAKLEFEDDRAGDSDPEPAKRSVSDADAGGFDPLTIQTEPPTRPDVEDAAGPMSLEEFSMPMPSSMIDEADLRDLVSEIVRSELQGELGERITRNVRKLVRREVNRALAGQDLI